MLDVLAVGPGKDYFGYLCAVGSEYFLLYSANRGDAAPQGDLEMRHFSGETYCLGLNIPLRSWRY